jgi:DHA2 family multidrug resistance protein
VSATSADATGSGASAPTAAGSPPASGAGAGAGGLLGLSPSARMITAFAVAFGTFIQVLDTTIANVSVPVVSGDLGVSNDQGTWVITSFAVANGITVPLTGWLMQRFGLVRTFVASVVLFTLASLLCGLAWSLPSLLAFRVLQGAVSGPLIPGSQAVLLAIFPPDKRTLALGIWSITTSAAPIAGPTLGGYISDNYSWPWIFLINVPIGALSAFICWRFVGKRDTPTRRVPVDTVGLGLLVVWVGALQILLDKGKDADWFASSAIVVLALVAAIGFVAFLIWELTARYPIVDLSLFKLRNFSLGTIAICLGYGIFFGNLVLYPLWLQTQENYTATWAGLIAAPSGLVAVFLTPIVGRIMSRGVDARWIGTVAIVAFGLAYLMRAHLTPDASLWNFTAPALVQGIGMSTFFIGLIAITLNGVPPERIPSASGLTNFTRITAGSFATSIVTTLWDRHEAFHQSRLVEGTSVFDPAMQSAVTGAQSLGLSYSQSLGLLARNIAVQAYAKSAIDFFWISAWLTFALVGILWFTRRTVASGGAPVAAD